MASHQIPGDKSRIDRSFEVITDRNNIVLQQIAEDPSSGLINKYYSACMDTNEIEGENRLPLVNLRQQLYGGSDKRQMLVQNIPLLFKNGVSALFEFGTSINPFEPSKTIYALDQGGLTLPSPAYYSDSKIFNAYVDHIAEMLNLSGFFGSRTWAVKIANFEAALANITVPRDQLYNPFKSNNLMKWGDVVVLTYNLPMTELITALGIDSSIPVDVDAPKFLTGLNDLIARTPIGDIEWYFTWKLTHAMAPLLTSSFVEANFKFFGTVLTGVTVPAARSKTCLAMTTAVVPDLVGAQFVKKAFSREAKDSAQKMYDAILATFQITAQKLSWMDPQTLQRAQTKLKQLLPLIGYPENPRTYASYQFKDGYAANWQEAQQAEWTRMMAEAGKPSDRTAWHSPASIVNAFFSPTTASVFLPAGILQSPFFDFTFPDAMNFGGIGMVTGHELTHSLDSKGRNFDGTGKLTDWWTPSTTDAFQKRVDCIIAQYSKFSPLPGYYINGNLTQGENIADAGGLKMAHGAYIASNPAVASQQSIVPGLTNEQLLFVGFGQTWCSKLTDSATKNRILTDPHSPPQFRVNGASMNLPAFATAFKCPANAPMNPSNRCEIW